jgi:hypothetical protein
LSICRKTADLKHNFCRQHLSPRESKARLTGK